MEASEHSKTTTDLGSLFESDDEKVLALARRVMEKCVLERIQPPQEPLEHRWIRPGGPHYVGQWIWDTMFVVDLLSLLPDKKDVIREVFQNYWDFQDRWDREKPEYAHGMITVAIKTAPQAVRQFSQIPILAWGLQRVLSRNGDMELVRRSLARLEKFHDWFWRERDVTNVGLIAPGAYTGRIQHARWESFDFDCAMDDLKLTPHPTRKGKDEGAWYGSICTPGNTSYLILGERSLASLAAAAGDREMAERRTRRADKGVKAMRKHMWDDEAGTFLAVQRDSLEKVPGPTISSWIPLAAGVPDKDMAVRMAKVLASEDWQTPLPVPTVARSDERFRSRGFWRGDVWPPTNYQISSGLADYGHAELAADIADKTIANAIEKGISENYDSLTGEPLGVRDYCMSATLVTMMLDGISRKHKLTLKKTAQREK